MAAKAYAYYPGCSLLSTAKEYDISVRAVFAHLGIELHEIEDWSCCGAVHADVNNPDAAFTLPARNLALGGGARLRRGHRAVQRVLQEPASRQQSGVGG